MTIKERLQLFIKHKGLTNKAFELQCGLGNGFVSKVGDSIRREKLLLISKAFPDLDTDWVINEKGKMLKTATPSTSTSPKISYTAGVPYYDVDFIGGFDLVENDQTMTPAYNIDFKAYDKATCWCNITGHSMEPEINHGDIIALRKIDDFSFLPAGEVYAIVTTNDMRTVKRIGISDNPDNYRLIPTNKSPEYSVQELPKRMIRAVFEVLGCMKKL